MSTRILSLSMVAAMSYVSLLASTAGPHAVAIPLVNWQVPDGKPSTAAERFVPASSAVSSAPANFVAMTPCRVVDTRNPLGPYGGPQITSYDRRTFDMAKSPCPGIPASATAYSLNVTVVGPFSAGWVTVYPTGDTRPFVSTVNFAAGDIIANAVIVPAGTSGAIDAYSVTTTNLIVDINGYFKPDDAPSVVTPIGIGDFDQQFGSPVKTKVTYGSMTVPAWTLPQSSCITASAVIPPRISGPPTFVLNLHSAVAGTIRIRVGSTAVAATVPPGYCIYEDAFTTVTFDSANSMQRLSVPAQHLDVCGTQILTPAGAGDTLQFRVCNGGVSQPDFSVTGFQVAWP